MGLNTGYAWFYNVENVIPSDIIRKCTTNNITKLFVSMDATLMNLPGTYKKKLINFLNYAKLSNIEVHALVIDHNDCYANGTHYKALDRVNELITFVTKNVVAREVIKGIHIDSEPYVMPEWNDTTRNDLLGQYHNMLLEIKNKIRSHGSNLINTLNISVATASWFQDVYEDGLLPNGNMEIFAQTCDFVVLMAYWDSNNHTASESNYVTARIEKELAVIPVICGLNVAEYTSLEEFTGTRTNVYNTYIADDNYLGFAYFHLGNLT